MLARDLVPTATKLEFTKGGGVERIFGKAVSIGDPPDLFKSAFGSRMLCNGDGAVECNNRGRTNRHQRVVEENDLSPILSSARCASA